MPLLVGCTFLYFSFNYFFGITSYHKYYQLDYLNFIVDEDHGEKAVTINLDGIESEIILLDFPAGEISVSMPFDLATIWMKNWIF